MSDFVSAPWSWFVAIVTAASLAACLVLLAVAARRRVMSDDDTTGHVWDEDLRELNEPLPRWWMWVYVATVVYSIAYLALYPGLGSFAGLFGWSSAQEYRDEVAVAAAASAPIYAAFEGRPAESLARDAQAMALGERLFINQCATCHGSNARGSKGFPDLTDRDWLWGGSPERIAETIAQGRQGTMPPLAAAIGSADDVRNVAHYVLSLSGGPHDSVAAYLGRAKFAVCAGCHGADGKGNAAVGAPNLTDRVWLHGWGTEAIAAIVRDGKTNVMPPQAGRLTNDQIKLLAAYVWSLSQPKSP
jgi:cytochrome c oxidase cbb3-type subunit III